jgi:hypothetical protein
MTYRFRTKSSGDVLMLEPGGDAVLQAMGIPPAPKGIIEPHAMPAAFKALEVALAQDVAPAAHPDTGDGEAAVPVSLRQRAWPLLDMMRRAHQANEPIVWGV